MAVPPRSCPLDGGTDTKHHRVVVRVPDDLNAGRYAARRQPTRHGENGTAVGYVERRRQVRLPVVLQMRAGDVDAIEIVAVRVERRTRRRADQRVVTAHRLRELELQTRLDLESVDVAIVFGRGPRVGHELTRVRGVLGIWIR